MSAVAEHKPQSQAVATRQSASIMDLITQAVQGGADMATVRELKDMAKELAQDEAQRDFNTAMGQAQSEMGRVAADANNPQTRSKYATYAALDKALRPVYTKHGFAISFDTGDGAPDGHIRVLAYVTHSGGFTRTYRADMPNDGKGAKGGDVMTKTHASGAAMSYGMRYLLKMIFNVAVGEDDTDGNVTGETITEQQRDDLLALIGEVGGSPDVFCKYFKIDAIGNLPAAMYQRAVTAVEAKRKK